jgi:hypothetical protein
MRETKMAARWVGLTRPNKKGFAARAARSVGHTIHEFLHAIGAVGVLVMAAAMNFALYPDALAAVVTGQPVVALSVLQIDPALIARQHEGVTAPRPIDETEVSLLAATAWGEARSEGEDGMRAVAHVMVNRIGPRFGENLSTVILSPKQFSVWNRGDPNRRLVINAVQNPERFAAADPEWDVAKRVAREVLSGQSIDPTGGALFYHTRAVHPRWAPRGRGRQVIGAHVFYADVPDPGIRDTPRLIDIAQIVNAPLEAERSAPARRRVGPRAGRVHGRIQHAPVGSNSTLPAPTTVISSPTPSIEQPTPVTTASAATAAF